MLAEIPGKLNCSLFVFGYDSKTPFVYCYEPPYCFGFSKKNLQKKRRSYKSRANNSVPNITLLKTILFPTNESINIFNCEAAVYKSFIINALLTFKRYLSGPIVVPQVCCLKVDLHRGWTRDSCPSVSCYSGPLGPCLCLCVCHLQV